MSLNTPKRGVKSFIIMNTNQNSPSPSSSSCHGGNNHKNINNNTAAASLFNNANTTNNNDITSPTSSTCSSPDYYPTNVNNSGGINNNNHVNQMSKLNQENRRGRPRSEAITSLISEGETSPSAIKCTFCHRVFPREKSLQAHLRIHTGERPYPCDFPGCSRAFTQSGQLKTHQRLHTGERPFLCSAHKCDMRFTHANRHCPEHPYDQLQRCDDFNIQSITEQSSEVLKWLEKYKEDRTPTRKKPLKRISSPYEDNTNINNNNNSNNNNENLEYNSDSENNSGSTDQFTPVTPSTTPYKIRKSLTIMDMNARYLDSSPLAPIKIKPTPKIIQYDEPPTMLLTSKMLSSSPSPLSSHSSSTSTSTSTLSSSLASASPSITSVDHQYIVNDISTSTNLSNDVVDERYPVFDEDSEQIVQSSFYPKKRWLREAWHDDFAKPLDDNYYLNTNKSSSSLSAASSSSSQSQSPSTSISESSLSSFSSSSSSSSSMYFEHSSMLQKEFNLITPSHTPPSPLPPKPPINPNELRPTVLMVANKNKTMPLIDNNNMDRYYRNQSAELNHCSSTPTMSLLNSEYMTPVKSPTISDFKWNKTINDMCSPVKNGNSSTVKNEINDHCGGDGDGDDADADDNSSNYKCNNSNSDELNCISSMNEKQFKIHTDNNSIDTTGNINRKSKLPNEWYPIDSLNSTEFNSNQKSCSSYTQL